MVTKSASNNYEKIECWGSQIKGCCQGLLSFPDAKKETLRILTGRSAPVCKQKAGMYSEDKMSSIQVEAALLIVARRRKCGERDLPACTP
jgi:hypothetical protein